MSVASDDDDDDANFKRALAAHRGTDGVERNYMIAARLFESLAHKGFLSAKYNLALMYLDGFGVYRDECRGFCMMSEVAAEAPEGCGHDDAEFIVAECLRHGVGCARDAFAAARRYRRSIALGCKDGYHPIGAMYWSGELSDDDNNTCNVRKAVQWYKLGVAAGCAKSMRGLGHLYRSEGRDDEAVALFRAAAVHDANAYCDLGIAYTDGRGVPLDYVEARRCFEKATVDGVDDRSAHVLLGSMLQRGIGGAVDVARAVHHYRRACVLGDDLAPAQLQKLGLPAPPANQSRPCAVCGTPSDSGCAACRDSPDAPRYCSRRHQREHWPQHRQRCNH
jgi:TPR repeat protein